MIMRCLCGKSVARKCACAIRRSGNDAILSFLYANVSKKFQLLRHVGLFPFDLAPEIANLAVLLVRDAQHAGIPRRRHRFAYPFDMYRHILLGCAMSYINRVLHHGKTVGTLRFMSGISRVLIIICEFLRLRQNGVEKKRVCLIMARTFEYYVAGDRQFEIVSLDESVELSVKYFYERSVLFVGFPCSVFGFQIFRGARLSMMSER